jgi:hypothetical protein
VRRADHSSRGGLLILVFLECDREASIRRRPWTTRGCFSLKKNSGNFINYPRLGFQLTRRPGVAISIYRGNIKQLNSTIK